jgi:prolyl oligopeptidase
MAFDTREYPAARHLDLTEDILGHQVSDPYRWLESPSSPEAADWLGAQAALWTSYRDAELGRRAAFAARVAELTHVGHVGLPAWRGERRFFIRRDPGRDHGVLYVADGDGERALVDPIALDASGRTTLDAWQPDKEGRLLAYQVSSGGDEESVLYVIDVATGAVADGPIDRCRYSQVAWLPGGKAFYYTRKLGRGAAPAGEEQYHRRVYLHAVGTDPASDPVIFGVGRDKTAFFGINISLNGRWLVLSESIGTAPRDGVWIADLAASDPAAPEFTEVVCGKDARTSAGVGRDGRLYVWTDLDAPRGRLCVADPAAPGVGDWRDLIPQDPSAVLRGYTILDDVIVASWTRHAIGSVTVHSLASGSFLSSVSLPGLGTVGGLSSRPEGGHEAWIGYTDYGHPLAVLRFDFSSASVSVWATAPGLVDLPELAAEQVTYTSADGTRVRMMVLSAGGVLGSAGGGGGGGGGGAACDPVRVRGVRHFADARVLRKHPRLGGGGRRVRGRRAARRQ